VSSIFRTEDISHLITQRGEDESFVVVMGVQIPLIWQCLIL
jgi:hypothetical protein